MAEKLKILFVPIDAVGHINCVIGVGQVLVQRGHSVTVAITSSSKGKLRPFGFDEMVYYEQVEKVKGQQYQNEIMSKMEHAMALTPIEKYEELNPQLYSGLIEQLKAGNSKIAQIIAQVQPDLILADGICFPAVVAQKQIPWMGFISLNPLGFTIGDVPPAYSAYPTYPKNADLWTEFIEKTKPAMLPVFEDFKSWVLKNGGPELTYSGSPFWTQHSPWGTLYMFPQELDYVRNLPPNFHRFDTFMRQESGEFEIPQKLVKLPGKLVYLSMGTIGCSNLGLMRNLIRICSKAPHRFIVSTGPLGDKLELGHNMWGAKSVPQTKVIPLVDLVISHGGNNTVTETFYFGKRLLILQLFCDQLDNGQRVAETGLGLTFDPSKVTDEQLLSAIDQLLGDELLEKRMKTISIRMMASNSTERAADLIEKVARSQ